MRGLPFCFYLDAKRDEEATAHVYTENSRFSRRRYYPLPRVTKK